MDSSPRGGGSGTLIVRGRDRDRGPASDAPSPRAEGERHADAAPVTTSRGLARRSLAETADRLMEEARKACRRDGVRASRNELFARIARRIGLSQAEVAQRLRGHAQAPAGARRTVAAGRETQLLQLAEAVLGARECEVFLARCRAHADDVEDLHQLAGRLRISVERIYQLEASACYKLTRAMTAEDKPR